jgi:VIT1/CCC1 family predicted Fe2+/Mn2+ transporter
LLEVPAQSQQNSKVLVKHKTLDNKLIWLRAAVLGANDGITSVAGLVMGVAGAGGDRPALLLAGVAATVAGAISMGGGEYISVSAQKDTEISAGRRYELITANPWAAAWSSALAFTMGALLPLVTMTGPWEQRELATACAVITALSITGWWAAWAGRFQIGKSIVRNVTVSVLTMGLAYLVGHLFGVAVA